MNGTTYTADLQNALAGAEQLAVEKTAEIIKQEWPKINNSFTQLVANGEQDMKVTIDLFLTSASDWIGVKAAMLYKIVNKARVVESFARFDGTVQQELPLPGSDRADASADENEGLRPDINLEDTATEFGFIDAGGNPDLDALFAAATGIFTEAQRNSSFLLTRQIGCTLDEAQEILRTMNAAGALNPDFERDGDTAADIGKTAVDSDASAAQAEVDAGAAVAAVDADAQTNATPWADTPEEAEAMLDRAMAVLNATNTPRVAALQRKMKLPFGKAQALFDAVQSKMAALKQSSEAGSVADAVPPSIVEKRCVDCATFDACAVSKPHEQNVQCDGFAAREGAV